MNERIKIILADDHITNLKVGKNALSGNYDVYTVPSGEKLLTLLDRIEPDMILLDIEMPGMNGYEVIKRIKSNPKTSHISVIFLTSRTDAGSELEGLSLGAIDYIFKPFSPALLLKRIEMHLLVEHQKRELQNYNDNLEEMVRQKTQTILELKNVVLETMSELVEYRDDVTGGHISRTQKYFKILTNEMLKNKLYFCDASEWDVDLLVLSSQLHDIGKIAISDNILRKPEKLTSEEFDEMKKHTIFGEKIIEKIQSRTSSQEFLSYAKTLAVYHHERWDGTGYPYGFAGKTIPLAARLMATVDVYDALTSTRPYKPAFSHEVAVKIIAEGKGTQFDPALVDLFLSISDKFNCEQQI